MDFKCKLDKKLQKFVQFHAYVVTIAFVAYLFVVLGVGLTEFFRQLVDIATGVINGQERLEFGIQVLHDLAFTIVLYKAFVVLRSYARTLHINTKLILELAIIAPVVELIFNFHSLSYTASAIYAAMAVLMSAVYLNFYEKIRLTQEDHDRE